MPGAATAIGQPLVIFRLPDMNVRIFSLVFATLLTGLVGGCVEVRQSLVIEGSQAEYGGEIRVDARLAALAQRDRNRLKGFCDEIQVPAEARSRGIEVDISQRTGQGEVICTVRLRGPVEVLFLAMDRKGGSGLGSVSVERIDSRTLRIENVIGPMSQARNGAQTQGFESSMAESLFAGKLISWSVRAPRVLDSNGVIAADGRSVEWSVPVGEAMKAQQRFHATLRLELTTLERARLWFADQWRAIRRVLRELLAD